MLAISILCAVSIVNTTFIYAADIDELSIGDYIQLGTYTDAPIIWRYIDEDENGKLMLSDKILCYKAFDARNHKGVNVKSERHGCGFWEESTLRTWLNSTESGENIEWPGQNPPTHESAFWEYDQEDGFLSSTNFSSGDLQIMKTVSQWNLLDINEAEKSTNGIYYSFGYNYYPGKAYWFEGGIYKKVSELSHVEGAMYRLNDTVFLLNETQVYNLWNNFGTVIAGLAEFAENQNKDSLGVDNTYWWLRSGSGSVAKVVHGEDSYSSNPCYPVVNTGVRPAFYLNEKNAMIKSGGGTKDDPYILEGKDGNSITVFSNGKQLDFNVEPIIENDRTLVGMRAVFEALGADVEWESDTSTAVAIKDNIKIRLQINNDIMLVDDAPIQLDAPARIINDNTMVPLRAVSESLGADVEWIGNLNRIVIDKPKLPMDFGDGVGKENWQTGKFGDWRPDITKFDGGYSDYQKSISQ